MSNTWSFEDIFNSVIKNKLLFETKSNLFWEKSIKPLWLENDKKKLGIHKNSIYFYNSDNSNKWKDDFEGIVKYESVVYNHLSELDFSNQNYDLVKKAFLWFVGTNLLFADKYFNRNSLKGLHLFNAGIEFNVNWNDDVLMNEEWVFKKYDTNENWLYDNSILELGFFEANIQTSEWVRNKILKNKEVLKEKIKIKDFDEILSKGFFLWVAKNRLDEIKLPEVIDNKMKFMVWKKIVESKPVTEKRLKKIMSESRLNVFKFPAFNFLCQIEGLKDKKFFSKIISETHFFESEGGETIHKNYELIDKFIVKVKIENRNTWQYNKWAATLLEKVDPEQADLKFLTWAKNSDVIKQSGIFNECADEQSYLSENRYWENLEKIYKL